MKQFFTFLAVVLLTAGTYAQVGIGTTTPAASAALEVTSIDNNKGILIPRLTAAQKDGISTPAEGLLIYQIDITKGFYYYNGSSWTLLGEEPKVYTVNTFYAELGGYVFEVNSDGTHGLVVAKQDQGLSTFYGVSEVLNDPAKHDIDGAKFKDWQLPSMREFGILKNVPGLPGLADYDYYWCSSERDVTYANTKSKKLGEAYERKTYSVKLRAVRAF